MLKFNKKDPENLLITFLATLFSGLIVGLATGFSSDLATGLIFTILGATIFTMTAWAVSGSLALGFILSASFSLWSILSGVFGSALRFFPLQTLGALAVISSPFLFGLAQRRLRGRRKRKAKRELEKTLEGLNENARTVFKVSQELIYTLLSTPGFSALKPKAEEVLASLPSLAIEIRSMDVAMSTTHSDIKRRMYEDGRMEALENLANLTHAFNSERLRLEEANRVEKIQAEPEALRLPTVAVFAELTEDVLRMSEAVMETEDVTPPGTELERQFRELSDNAKALPFRRGKKSG